LHYNPIRLFLLISILSINLKTYGQHSGKWIIRGSITDTAGKVLTTATVAILKATDSSLIKGVVTDDAGKFEFINLPSGDYIINATHQGFASNWSGTISLDSIKATIFFSNIKLIPEDKTMNEVTITAKKPFFEQKIDRIIVNVASNISSAGSNALEVLERSPGIVVDQQYYTLSMNGKAGVVVMINGRINHMTMAAVVQMLAGMNADNIEKIELITAPPANLDAEGNAGYINIILKSSSQYGTNGSYSLTGGYGRGLITKASANLNYRKNKSNFYGDFSFSKVHFPQIFNFYRKVANLEDTTETSSVANRNVVELFYSGRLGLDYQISKKTIIGVLFSGYDDKVSIHSNNNTTVTVNHNLDSTLVIVNDEVNNWHNLSGNFNLQHDFSNDEKIIFNLNYDFYKDNNPVSYLNSYYDSMGNFLYSRNIISQKQTPINVWAIPLDYSKKISAKVSLEAGIKSTFSEFQNNVQIDTLTQNTLKKDDTLSAIYRLQENINAAYSSINIAFDTKTNLKAGLRYEYTYSNLSSQIRKNIVDRHYGNLFPSLFLSHTINENNAVNLTYTRRITRPTFNDMAPFVIFLDPFTFFSGNPALQPSITDALSTSYIYKKKIFSFSYSHEANPITDFFPKIDSINNILTLAAQNQKNMNTISFSLALPFKISNWWSMQNNIIGNWQQLNGFFNNTPIHLTEEYVVITSTHDFSLPKDITMELSGNFNSGGFFGAYQVKPNGLLNLSLQKKLVKSRSSISFNVLNMFRFNDLNIFLNIPGQNLVTNDKVVFNYTSYNLTFSHNFGNDKVKEKRNRTTGAEDEKSRVQ
jgi:Outer membrane protein beta-barrel family/Carboxypeptidase regulatory-like domain